jgi:hypothetical protein
MSYIPRITFLNETDCTDGLWFHVQICYCVAWFHLFYYQYDFLVFFHIQLLYNYTSLNYTVMMMHLTVPWKGKLTDSNQVVTVEVRCCETGPVSEVTA